MKKDKLVSIIIVTKDRGLQLLECVESFLESTYKPLEIIVVDNASKVAVSKVLGKSKFKNLKIIRNKKNFGAAEGRNIGYRSAKGKFLLFSDDDAVADEKMVANLVAVLRKSKDTGIVQPVIFDKENPKVFQGAGHDISLTTGRIKPWGVDVWGRGETDKGQYKGVREVPMCGCVWMVKREVFEKIGEYDKDYFIPYEDSDFSIRARKAGYKLSCVGDAISYHPMRKKNTIGRLISFLGVNSPERAYRLSRNKIIFMKKHSPFPQNIFFFGFFFPLLVALHTGIMIVSRRFDVLVNYWKGIFSGLDYFFVKSSRLVTKIIYLTIVSVILSYIALHPSFALSIFGDDWLVFFGLENSMGPGKSLDPSVFRGYFGPYVFPHFYMAVVEKFWGYNASPYYLTSFVFRNMAVVAFSALIYKLTKNFWSAVLAASLFAVTSVGLETTNWVFNAPSYLSILFISLSFILLLDSKQKFYKFLFSLIFLALSVMMFPQRMHGAIPLFGGFYLILSQMNWREKFTKFLLKAGLILLLFIFLIYMKTFGPESDAVWFRGEIAGDFKNYGPTMLHSIFPSLINTIVPASFWANNGVRNFISDFVGGSQLTPRFRIFLMCHLLFSILITKYLKKGKLIFIVSSSILATLWIFLAKQMIGLPSTFFIYYSTIFSTFLGVSIMIILVSYALVNIKSKNIALVYLVIFWPLLFLLIPWARSRFQPMDPAMRYMILAGAWLPLLFGFLISNVKKPFFRVILLMISFFILLLHIEASYTYLGHMRRIRPNERTNRIWAQIEEHAKNSGFVPSKETTVFYFEGDYENIYYNISFGFPPRIALIYGVSDADRQKIPLAVDRYEDLVTMYKKRADNGFSFDRFYAFKVAGSELSDIKENVRARLLVENQSERL